MLLRAGQGDLLHQYHLEMFIETVVSSFMDSDKCGLVKLEEVLEMVEQRFATTTVKTDLSSSYR